MSLSLTILLALATTNGMQAALKTGMFESVAPGSGDIDGMQNKIFENIKENGVAGAVESGCEFLSPVAVLPILMKKLGYCGGASTPPTPAPIRKPYHPVQKTGF